MNENRNFRARSLSAVEYILALHERKDQVAVVSVNRRRRQTLQGIATAGTIASPEFQTWLTEQNRLGSDVFVGMNPLEDGATHRTKESIREIRHVYLDLDEDAKAALANLRDSLDVPAPNFVLDTSPAKYQVVWKIDGLDLEQAESLLHSLANHFGGDMAATDAARVLRLPGFVNRKYANETEFIVQAHEESNLVHRLRDFAVHYDSPDFDLRRPSLALHSVPRGHKSQSEADWAFATRALERGDDPEEVIRRIADYRADDKAHPAYYARLTVNKAQRSLAWHERKLGPWESRGLTDCQDKARS